MKRISHFHCADDEFIQAPRNHTVEAGENVTLNCRHRFGQTHHWTANGLTL